MASRLEKLWPPLIALAASTALFYVGTGFRPVSILTWVAPLPVLWLATRVGTPVAVPVAGLAWFLGSSNTWAYYLDSYDVPLPIALGILVGCALLFALSVWLFRALAVPGRVVLASLAAPALWTGASFLIGKVSPVGVIGQLMTTQTDLPATLQLASVTGGWGVEFLVLFVPAGIAAAVSHGIPRSRRIRAAVVTGAVLVLALGFGIARMSADPGESRNVALLVRDNAAWAPDVALPEGAEAVAAYAAQIAALPAEVDLVVLPEGAFSAFDDTLGELTGPLGTVAAEHGVDIVAGLILFEDGGPDRGGTKWNTAIAIPASGTPSVYRMWNANTDGSKLSRGGELAFVPGGGTLALGVCRDVNFPDPAASYAEAGARMWLLPAQDQVVNGRQHAVAGVLRAMEHGMSLAWSSKLGTLMLTDAYGRILAEADADKTHDFVTVVAEVPAGPGATFYTRTGDWFPWGCAGLAAGAFALVLWGRRGRSGA
ncbi:nitrilase-related carbon-nitrogen hydrolase [Phytomonospora endophytica]|uniref:Apolipoprotein N-acyltransferase n=1 Tax=Phytomonospora endophytica TaxID=714109 RepID=A0A841FH83_9ACTN|nr:nitrilase-related carbon-nitrogen hydrolase [Phytomonospora endophytica]MBB6035085.1 apolipoprotein N-acyltransferase [Phytomonospora endophytica]GIG64166.1 apolipoprotein N-acyltransferase [Phytomonospora endophytica]